MRTTNEETNEFSMIIGLHHQGPNFKFLSLCIDMDKLTAHIQEKVTWSMSFANDITLVDESKDDVNAKLER